MRSTTLILAALGVIAGGAYIACRDGNPAAIAKPASVAAANPITGAKPAAIVHENPAPAAAAPVQTLAVAPAIAAVLPSLTSQPTTWRDYKPASIAVAIDGRAQEFVQTHVSTTATATTWTGRSASGSTLAAVGTAQGWTGRVMTTTGAEHVVSIAGNGARVVDADPMHDCRAEHLAAAFAPSSLAAVETHSAAATTAANYTVDVLFLYTQETLDVLATKGITDVEAYVRTMLTGANTILEQSLVDEFRWRFVGAVKAPTYPTQLDIINDLTQVSATNGAIHTFAASKRDEYGADQVVLLTGNNRNASGVAWPTPEIAYSVVVALTGSANLAHELGHNFGLKHDRTTEKVADGTGGYAFGHYTTLSLPFGSGIRDTEIGDIMSYHGQRPYFSNPELVLEVGQIMDGYAEYFPEAAKTLVQMGLPEGNPRAADAARWLREHAKTVADLRQTTVVEPSSSTLINLSTRAYVGTGDNVAIAGFVIDGSAPKRVLIRASGPALAALGVSGTIADPVLDLHSSSGRIGGNDNWSNDATTATEIEAVAASTGAFAWSRGSKDAALLVMLNPGAYTAIVSGVNGGTGVTLVEVYSADTDGAKLIDVSTRACVGTGDAVAIAGFVISGSEPKTVLVRAAGPALTPLGVSGVLANPRLDLHRGSDVIASSDDWSSSSIAAVAKRTGAFEWAAGSKDAALLVTLEPGAYTAVVSGGTGVTLVEVYEAR